MKHRFYIFAAFGASLLVFGSFVLAFAARSLPKQTTPLPVAHEQTPAEPESTSEAITRVIIGEPSTTTTPTVAACITGGCSGEICTEEDSAEADMTSICVYRPEYACFKHSRCERQPNGQCGWTQTSALNQCITSPSSEETTY